MPGYFFIERFRALQYEKIFIRLSENVFETRKQIAKFINFTIDSGYTNHLAIKHRMNNIIETKNAGRHNEELHLKNQK